MKNIVLLISAILVFNSCDLLKGKSDKTNDSEVIMVEKPTASKLKNGTKKYHFDTGELKSIVEYKDNKKVGISTTYYKTGEKQYDIPYVDGMKHGLVNWYYKNGKLYRETSYARGKKNGYQKKFWDNKKLKSVLLYENNLPAIGLKEFNNKGKEKTAPYIKVEKINMIKTKQEYVLKFRLSNGRTKVQFYQGKLIDAQFFPVDGRGFIELNTIAGVGELRINIPKGFNIEKDIHIVAVEKTSYQNDRILSTMVPIAIRNPN